MEKLAKRKQNRLQNFDYSTNGAYFITICTHNKECILSNIVGEGLCALPKINLNPIGEEIEKSINYINDYYDNIKIVKHIIMPNHIHLLIEINNRTGEHGDSPNKEMFDFTGGHGDPPLQSIVGQLKSYTTHKYGKQLWQRSYYDHIIRNEEDYLNVWEYINNNAKKWTEDKYYII